MNFQEAVWSGIPTTRCARALFAAMIGLLGLCPFANAQSIQNQRAGQQPSAEHPGDRKSRSGGSNTTSLLPTPRTPDGTPDFSGVWDGHGGAYLNKEIPGGKLPYSPAGLAAYRYNMTKFPDPQSLCIIIGQPRADLDNRPFEIVQDSTRVAFLYERDATFRVIRIDGSPHPPDPDPTFFGDAIGHWKGDTLVVDVTALKGQKEWADNVGHPHSDDARLTERWSRPDKNHLLLDLTMNDPTDYTQALHVTRTFRLQSWQGVGEEACAENNIDEEHLGPGLGTRDGSRGFDKSIIQGAATPASTAPAVTR